MKRLYKISRLVLLLTIISLTAVAQDLTTSGVPTGLCERESFTIGFDFAGGVSAGNVYNVELSDAVGSFISPVVIGSLASTELSGTIYCTIPGGTAYGSGYQVRVVATDPTFGQVVYPSGNINIDCTTRDYYWIGGTGNWSNLSKWEWTTDDITFNAATELPTEHDNVIFDDTTFPSGGRLTIDVDANCNDLYWDPASAANNPNIWSQSYSFNVFGDLDLSDGVYYDVRYTYFYPDKYNIYLNFADNLYQANSNDTYWKKRLYFYNNYSRDLDSDIIAERIYIYGSEFYTNGYSLIADFTIYSNSILYASTSYLESRELSIYGTADLTQTDVLLRPDYNGNAPYIYGSQTYNSVTIDGGVCSIYEDNNFASLYFSNGGGANIQFNTHQVITNELNIQGGDRSTLAVIKSMTPGSQHTFNINLGASVFADYVDITDSEIINVGSPGTPYVTTNGVDGGNNLGWSFSSPLSPLEYYWTGGTGDWSDVSHWNTSSDGGTTLVAASEGPALIDNVHFTAESFPASGQITLDQNVTIQSMIWEPGSGATNPTLYGDWSNWLTIKADLVMDDGVQRRAYRLRFDSSQGINNITAADNYNVYGDIFLSGGGTVNLLDDLFVGASFFIQDATLNTNDNSITVQYGFYVDSDLASINFGSSDIYLWDAFYCWASTPTLDFGTSTMHFGNDWNGTTRIDGTSSPAFTFNTVEINGPHQIYNSNSFNTLNVNSGGSLTLRDGQTQTVNTALNLTGSRSQLVEVNSENPGVPATLSVAGSVNADYVQITDNTIIPGGSATNAIDDGGNTGWTFSAIVPFDYRWIGGAGKWSELSHWEYSTDGGSTWAAAIDVPGSVDNVFFTTNSFPNGGALTLDQTAHCNDMIWESGSGASFPSMQYSDYQNRLYIHGSLQMADGVSRNLNYLVFDSDNTGNTVDLADNLVDWGDIDFQGTGDWSLMSDLKTAYLNIRGGHLMTNDYNIEVFQQIYIGADPGTIDWGSSEVNLRQFYTDGYNMTFNADNSTFIFDGTNGNTSLRGWVAHTFNNIIVDGTMEISNSDWLMNSLEIREGSEVTFEQGRLITVTGSFNAIGSRSQMIRLMSNSSGNTATLFANTFGVVSFNAEYCIIEDLILDNGDGDISTKELAINSLGIGIYDGWDVDSSPLVSLDYYWIGGTGNWSQLSHWATTDGGSTLHPTPPGLVDNVFFTSNSFPTGGEITLDQVAACNDMVWTDGSSNPTIRGDYNNHLIVSGNFTIADGVNRFLERIVFNSSSTNNIILNDNRYEYSDFEFHGTGTWNLVDELKSNNINIHGGTLNTLDNPVTLDWDFNIHDTGSGGSVTLNFGSSVVTATNINNWNWSNTIAGSMGTSEIVARENGNIYGNTMSFYNLTLEGETYINVEDLEVVNELTLMPGAKMRIYQGKTITTGSLIANGTRPEPVTIESTQLGQKAYIVQTSGTVDASHIILKDNGASGGATFNATDAYDQGNVSGWNITPIVGQSYYWMAGSADWSDRNSWSLSDGTNVVPATAPGPADNIFVTTNSPLNSGGTILLDIAAECNDLTFSTDANVGAGISGTWENYLTVHGSFVVTEGVAVNLEKITFDSDETGNIIDLGPGAEIGNFYRQYEFQGTGDWTLNNDLATYEYYQQGGTLNTNGYTLETQNFSMYSNGLTVPTINLGASDFYSSYLSKSSDAIFNAGSSTLYIDESTRIYSSWVFNDVEVDGTFEIYDNNTYNNLTLQPGSILEIGNGTTQTVTKLNASGLRSRPIYIRSTQNGEAGTIAQASGLVSGDYLIITDNNALGSAVFSAQNSIDNGNVTGWNFTPITPRDYYWVGGSGKWSEFSSHWANSDGGTNFYSDSPGPLDNVFFTANSFPSDGTLTLDFPSLVDNMDWTGNTSNVTITHDDDDWGNNLTVGGSLTLANGVTRDINIYFNSDETDNTIFLADNLLTTARSYFNGSGTWTLTGDFVSYFTYFDDDITFITDNYNFTSEYIYMYENATTFWGSSSVNAWRLYSYLDNSASFDTETSTFKFKENDNNYIYSPYGSSRFFVAQFEGNTNVRGNNIFFNAIANAGEIIFEDGQGFNSLTMNEGTHLRVGEGESLTISAVFDLNGTSDNPIQLSSTNDGTAGMISMPATGIVNADYVHIRDNTATGGADFTATNSSDYGNVTGWNGLLTGQTIDFPPLDDGDNASFTVSASASSSLDVSYEIADGNATVSGTTITPSGPGLIGIRAVQAGDATYGSALPVIQYRYVNATTEPNELGNMKQAKLVIGQPDQFSQNTLYNAKTTPWANDMAVASNGALAIANDTRILVWSQIPTAFDTPADGVYGKPDFTSDISTASQSNLEGRTYGVDFINELDGTVSGIVVADYARVLIFDFDANAMGNAAHTVIGQSDFNSVVEGVGPTQLKGNALVGVKVFRNGSTNGLLIADAGNNRVLIYNTIPTSSTTEPDVVVGQEDFISDSYGTAANNLEYPIHADVSPDGKLVIADYGNSRVLVYNSIPTSNGASADVVIGQEDFGLDTQGIGPNQFTYSTGVSVSKTGKLAVADYSNHRVLIYNTIPTANGATPDIVLGQPDFDSNAINFNSISGRTMYYPISVRWDVSENLLVADRYNHRVLLFGAADLEGPEVSWTAPASHTAGSGTSASMTVTDRSGTNVVLYYRGISAVDQTFQEFLPPELGDQSNSVTYTLDTDQWFPAGEELGAEYYIEVKDGFGNSSPNVSSFLNIQNNSGIAITNFGVGSQQSNYKMFTVPLNLDDKDAKNVFDEITAGTYTTSELRIFSYPGGTSADYTEYGSGMTNIELGKGYFALAASTSSVSSGAGQTSTANATAPFEIELVPGWNMIGNPYNFNVTWADVLTESAISGTQPQDPQGYNGSWSTQSTLSAGVGYFVNNPTTSNITLKIPVTNTAGGRVEGITPNTNSLLEDNWEVRFLEKNADGFEMLLGGVGMDVESEDSFDQFDLINPPAIAKSPQIEFNHPEFFQPSFRQDYRPTSFDQKWDFKYSAPEIDNERTIYWDNSYYGEGSPDIYLVDKTHFKLINMKVENSYSFYNNGTTDFEVYFGYDAMENIYSDRLVTITPYPNPFADQVYINVGLPNMEPSSKVEVVIFNSLGKQVASLDTYANKAAFMEFVWNGLNDSGTEVPDGLYAFRVMVNGELNQTITGKVIKE